MTLPPLRDRREDIPLLVDTFRKQFSERTGHTAEIDDHELKSLQVHDWPGNVRELKNTVERALWLAQTGDGSAYFVLPSAHSLFAQGGDQAQGAEEPLFDPELSFSDNKSRWEAQFEKKYLAWLLARSGGSISQAARLASMDRKHLRTLLKKHELST